MSRTEASGARPRALPDLRFNPVVYAALGYLIVQLLARPVLAGWVAIASAAVGFGLAAHRHPVTALTVVVVGVPFQALVLAYLYKHGVGASSTAVIAYWKEFVLAIVFVRAFQSRSRSDNEPMMLIATALLALVVVYLVLPMGSDLRVRYVSARADVGFVTVFLSARWLPASGRQRQRLERAFLGALCVIAGLGLWNYFGQDGWARWVEGTGLRDYQRLLSDVEPPPAVLHTAFGSSEVVRAGSIFLSPNELAYTLLVGFSLAVSRLLRGRAGWLERCSALLLVTALVPTFCRSAIALLIVVGVILASGAGRLSRGAGVGAVVALLLLGLVGTIGPARDQVASGFNPDDSRTSAHIERLGESMSRITSRPLGSGLGTAAAVAIRFDVQDRVDTPENFYFQFATEVGLVGMVLFIAFVLACGRSLWARVRLRRDLDALAPAAALAALGLGAVILDTFQLISATWPLFALAGLALSPSKDPVLDRVAPSYVR